MTLNLRDHENGKSETVTPSARAGEGPWTEAPVSVYLSGPIAGCTEHEAAAWRRQAEGLLCPLHVLDPMRRAHRWTGVDKQMARRIVMDDKRDVLASRALLVFVDRPSVGTAMEVMFAFERGLPIHVVNQMGAALSPWHVFHATEVHDLLDGACARLRSLLLRPRL